MSSRIPQRPCRKRTVLLQGPTPIPVFCSYLPLTPKRGPREEPTTRFIRSPNRLDLLLIAQGGPGSTWQGGGERAMMRTARGNSDIVVAFDARVARLQPRRAARVSRGG